ncbi:hypothetical protein BVIR_919 [Blastochloris viridis]|nr:hypothetical protein BVIR_919 [Blastochloris viridis]
MARPMFRRQMPFAVLKLGLYDIYSYAVLR